MTDEPSDRPAPDQLSPTRSRVTRAPSDVLRLIVAGGLLITLVVVGLLFGGSVVGFGADLLRGLDTLPSWLVTTVAVAVQLIAVVLVVAAVVSMSRTRSWHLALAAAVAALLGAGTAALLAGVVDAQAERVTDLTSVAAVGQGSRWGVAVLGGLAGTMAAVGPWIPRRWRRLGGVALLVAALGYFIADPLSFGTLLALLAGWVAGTFVTVAMGSPSHRPTAAAITDGLAAVGLPLARLDPASVDARGSTPYFGETAAGERYFVKALGEDERSADLMFRLYRRFQPRDLGDEKPFSTLRRAVEHEALVSLTAGELGVRTPRLAAFATAEPDAYVLAYESIDGRSLDRLTADELTDDVLAGVWSQLSILRRHRVAHRDLRLANLFLADDGKVWLIDFGFAELAVSDRLLATDLAEMLASSATVVGPDRAVRAATRAVGGASVRTALDRLDLHHLSGATRTALKQDDAALPALRARVLSASS
jgi:glycosyltransferase 2 family protein